MRLALELAIAWGVPLAAVTELDDAEFITAVDILRDKEKGE